MKVTKTFRYRISPTKDQEILLSKHFGCKRFIFNYFLDQRKKAYIDNKKTLNYYDNARELTELKKSEDHIWLKEINSQSLQAALRDLDVAYNRFFHKQSKFPRFKSKHEGQSFRIPQFIEYENGLLWIPKFKKPIRVNEDRPLTGEILFATISRKPSGKYFVSITVETEHSPYAKTDKQVGIDLGIKTLATCSDGTTYENIKSYKKDINKLKYEQRMLSKKTKGGTNRKRQQKVVAKIHEIISNRRLNHLHQISSRIVRENQTIVLESLAVRNMMKNHCLAQSLGDSSFGELVRQLTYKSEWNERELIFVDRFFPSSKTCYECGWIKQDLTLEDREWICVKCGTVHNRDLNASKNILREGLNSKKSSGSGIESESKQKREEACVSKSQSMSHETQPSLVVG